MAGLAGAGAAIGFALVATLVFSVKEPNPDWGALWHLRPLIVTPLIAAIGAQVFGMVRLARSRAAWVRWTCGIVACVSFLVVLWIAIILGLDGTLWN